MGFYAEHKPSFVLNKGDKVKQKQVGPRTDKDVHSDLLTRLQSLHGIDTSGIELTIEKGRVHLAGKVSSRRVKTLVESLVDNTTGVRGVQSELVIGR